MTTPQRTIESSPADAHIGRALAALRLAEPHGGREQMEHRLLHSLADRATVPRPVRAHFSTRLVFCAAASAVLVTASLILLHHDTTPTNPVSVNSLPRLTHSVILSGASQLHRGAQPKDPKIARRGTSSEPFSTADLVHTVTPVTHALSSRPAASPAAPFITQPHPTNSGWPILSRSLRKGGVGMPTPPTTPDEATLLADLHAPSHPAPPLPPTPQEKAILAVLRHANAVELASLSDLDPVIRATRDADETAAFHAFFPDPPPLPQPNGDTE